MNSALSSEESAVADILAEMRTLARPGALEGMARFGINTVTAIGVSLPNIRKLAKLIGRDRALAAALWDSGIHDARILASMVDVPAELTAKQMHRWAKDFNSWDLCDQFCLNLFSRSPLAWEMAVAWTREQPEFVKRAAFALQAVLAVHEKREPDERFLHFFPLIEGASDDERNFVKKAVNWSLRQLGKRSIVLHRHAMETIDTLSARESKSARWIAANARRELESDYVRGKLGL